MPFELPIVITSIPYPFSQELGIVNQAVRQSTVIAREWIELLCISDEVRSVSILFLLYT